MRKRKRFTFTIFTIFVLTLLLTGKSQQAQSYYGYQTIGKHTFLFSLIWQGEPKIGFGYINRIYSGNTFNDLQIELRFPLRSIYRFSDYEAIAGIYKPLSYSRAFAGIGGHFRWESNMHGGQRVSKLSLAVTAIPSYVYAADINDGIYGTVGLRLTYAPVIFATSKSGGGKADWNFFPQHKFEGGLHFDMHIERTLGLAINGITSYYLNRKNTFLEKVKNWEIEGDFYFGTTYYLDRN
ncbi:MAG: hypothetical protein GXO86_11335 [Chlorobi bacterium]|nr:hypothetical protein [Chlorobiota bacterium]